MCGPRLLGRTRRMVASSTYARANPNQRYCRKWLVGRFKIADSHLRFRIESLPPEGANISLLQRILVPQRAPMPRELRRKTRAKITRSRTGSVYAPFGSSAEHPVNSVPKTTLTPY